MDARIIKREKHSRGDGYLVELFSQKYGDFNAIHSYLVSINPKNTRAGHFHKNKKELIFPVEGEIAVLLSNGSEKKEITLNSEAEEYLALIVPPNVSHFIKNRTNSKAKILVFSDSFDLEDTYKVEE